VKEGRYIRTQLARWLASFTNYGTKPFAFAGEATSMSAFKGFGRTIFMLYEKRPLLMNSLAGGTVYALSEFVVQVGTAPPPPPPPPSSSAAATTTNYDMERAASQEAASIWTTLQACDMKKVAQIGALGSVENGGFMLLWYSLLNKAVGSGTSTGIVLIKCTMDQIFFATQQDGLFLTLCALQHSEQLPDAIREVKKSFLTTWINDCSIWPLVNFVGFAAVPLSLQPTYMSCVQLFWQIYMSSVAASNKSGGQLSEADEDQGLEQIFRSLDVDGNGFIDELELSTGLKARGINVSKEEIKRMLEDADTVGGPGNAGAGDGVVSLEEFKAIAKKGGSLRTATLWEKVRSENVVLEKGAKAIFKKLEKRAEENKSKAANGTSSPDDTPVAVTLASTWRTIQDVLAEDNSDECIKDKAWQDSRAEAIAHSRFGSALLVILAVGRRVFFKI